MFYRKCRKTKTMFNDFNVRPFQKVWKNTNWNRVLKWSQQAMGNKDNFYSHKRAVRTLGLIIFPWEMDMMNPWAALIIHLTHLLHYLPFCSTVPHKRAWVEFTVSGLSVRLRYFSAWLFIWVVDLSDDMVHWNINIFTFGEFEIAPVKVPGSFSDVNVDMKYWKYLFIYFYICLRFYGAVIEIHGKSWKYMERGRVNPGLQLATGHFFFLYVIQSKLNKS